MIYVPSLLMHRSFSVATVLSAECFFIDSYFAAGCVKLFYGYSDRCCDELWLEFQISPMASPPSFDQRFSIQSPPPDQELYVPFIEIIEQ